MGRRANGRGWQEIEDKVRGKAARRGRSACTLHPLSLCLPFSQSSAVHFRHLTPVTSSDLSPHTGHFTSHLSPHTCHLTSHLSLHFTRVTSLLSPQACHFTPATSLLSQSFCYIVHK